MFLFKKRYFFSVIFLIPFYLSADTYSVNDKLYFGIGGGIISPNDVEIKTTTALTANNVAFSANIDGEFEQRTKELEIIKKQLSELKTKKKKDTGENSKQIIESASQNHRLS